MARTKQAHFKSQVISKLLERLPALHPWPKDAHDWYTKPSGSEIKLGIWDFFEIKWYEDDDDEDRRRRSVSGRDIGVACDLAWEYLEWKFPEELEQLLGGEELKEQNAKLEWTQELLIKEVERKFPGVFGNRGLGDADPVNLLVNRIMNEGRERPLEWIFSEIERALPDARKVAGAMYEIKDENAKLEQEIKKVEEECNFWREATLRLSKEVPADDETMARLGWTTEYK
jgi:hypothetical protein